LVSSFVACHGARDTATPSDPGAQGAQGESVLIAPSSNLDAGPEIEHVADPVDGGGRCSGGFITLRPTQGTPQTFPFGCGPGEAGPLLSIRPSAGDRFDVHLRACAKDHQALVVQGTRVGTDLYTNMVLTVGTRSNDGRVTGARIPARLQIQRVGNAWSGTITADGIQGSLRACSEE
jgi:hypothetical protein